MVSSTDARHFATRTLIMSAEFRRTFGPQRLAPTVYPGRRRDNFSESAYGNFVSEVESGSRKTIIMHRVSGSRYTRFTDVFTTVATLIIHSVLLWHSVARREQSTFCPSSSILSAITRDIYRICRRETREERKYLLQFCDILISRCVLSRARADIERSVVYHVKKEQESRKARLLKTIVVYYERTSRDNVTYRIAI